LEGESEPPILMSFPTKTHVTAANTSTSDFIRKLLEVLIWSRTRICMLLHISGKHNNNGWPFMVCLKTKKQLKR